jgi:hypothetical protein
LSVSGPQSKITIVVRSSGSIFSCIDTIALYEKKAPE